MNTLSYRQLTNRWDELSSPLREALYSEASSDFLWKTCEAEHIPDNKIHDIARIIGYVLMGFLHPEDMTTEIRDSVGIDLRIATSIAGAVNQRIFVPLRPEIDRAYSLATSATNAAPTIIEEIRPVAKAQASVSAPLPAKLPETKSAAVPTPTPQRPSTPVPPPTAPTKQGESATARKPFVLQTESVPRPILNAPNFRMPANAEDVMGAKNASVPLPARPAVVEFGSASMPKTMAMPRIPSFMNAKPLATTQTPPVIKPPVPEPMRTITEITPETLKAAAPTPRVSPRPSFTPLSQIPVPSPVAPKPQGLNVPLPKTPASTPLPQPPKPTITQAPKPPAPRIPTPQSANQSEKVVRKDYPQ